MPACPYLVAEPDWDGGEFFYVIGHLTEKGWTGPSKIGISNDPRRRLRGLRCGNPSPIHIFAVIKLDRRDLALNVERYLKFRLKERRLGGEWYDDEPVVVFETAALHVSMSMAETGLCDLTQAIAITHELARLVPSPGAES